MKRRWALAIVAWAGFAGCEHNGASPSFVVNGGVSSEEGHPMPDARVTMQGQAGGTSAESTYAADANGLLTLRIAPPSTDTYLTGTLHAAGYAPHALRVPVKAGEASATFAAVLRPIDRMSHFTLPSSSDGPTSFSIVRGDGQATVTVLPNTLVTPNGKIAVGDANMSLTYWSPAESLRTTPGDLLGGDANGVPQSLQTFGMVHVQVEQAGQMLEIAAGKQLPLAFQMPPEAAAQLSQPGFTRPALYRMDSNTGLWERRGEAAASPLAFAEDHGSVTAQLPRLGSWSLAGLPPPEGDGSIQQGVTEDP